MGAVAAAATAAVAAVPGPGHPPVVAWAETFLAAAAVVVGFVIVGVVGVGGVVGVVCVVAGVAAVVVVIGSVVIAAAAAWNASPL